MGLFLERVSVKKTGRTASLSASVRKVEGRGVEVLGLRGYKHRPASAADAGLVQSAKAVWEALNEVRSGRIETLTVGDKLGICELAVVYAIMDGCESGKGVKETVAEWHGPTVKLLDKSLALDGASRYHWCERKRSDHQRYLRGYVYHLPETVQFFHPRKPLLLFLLHLWHTNKELYNLLGRGPSEDKPGLLQKHLSLLIMPCLDLDTEMGECIECGTLCLGKCCDWTTEMVCGDCVVAAAAVGDYGDDEFSDSEAAREQAREDWQNGGEFGGGCAWRKIYSASDGDDEDE